MSMREIKFRAWIKSLKKYFYIVGFCFEDKTGIRLWYFQKGILVNQSFAQDDVILEQYIERKDLNGKEIYVGDIIKNRIGEIGIVIFLSWKAFIGFEVKCTEQKGHYCGFSRMTGLWNDMEVIGNINEDKERSCL